MEPKCYTNKSLVTHTHNTHHSPNLGEVDLFPIKISMISEGLHLKWPILKFPNFAKLWIMHVCGFIILTCGLLFKNFQGQSCNLSKENFIVVFHIPIKSHLTFDSWVLIFKSQIDSLIFDHSFLNIICASNLQIENMAHFGYLFLWIVQWSKKSSIWIKFGWQGTITMLRKQWKNNEICWQH